MKRLSVTLTALLVSFGLSVSAQAATPKHKTTKAKTTVVKKSTKKTTNNKSYMSGEVNPDTPADLRVNETNNVTPAPYATTPDRVAPTSVTVPVTRVTQTAPATQVTTVTPVDGDTVQKTTTTTVPVAVETVPVNVPVVQAP